MCSLIRGLNCCGGFVDVLYEVGSFSSVRVIWKVLLMLEVL